jgi:hypothetical protein
MAIRVEETYDSRSVNGSLDPNQRSIELEFLVWDDTTPPVDTDPVTLGNAVAARLADPPYGDPLYGLHLQSISLRELTNFCSVATVRYGVSSPPSAQQIKFGFSTAGGTENITHSMATIAAYAATGYYAPDYGQAINVTKSGIKGTSRIVPQLAFWVTGYFDPADWTAATWLNLTDLAGCWNLYEWHGWPPKYVLFEHAEAPEIVLGEPELVPVKFYFKARRPEVVANAPGISFIKDPWDYVWTDFVPVADNSAKAMGQAVRAVYREQIYAGADFALLGLGS